MIEINLQPRTSRRAGARNRGRGLPRLPRIGRPRNLPSVDRMQAFAFGAWIVSLLAVGWLYYSTKTRQQELALALDQAQQDSAHYARIINDMKRLTARRDTIAQKLEVIQQIDADRYVWAHVMDEISRALPGYTWVTGLTPVDDDTASVRFQLTGRTGSNFALTSLMKNLEASPFLRNVTLVSTTQVEQDASELYEFVLRAMYEEPAPDAITTVPLFVGGGGGDGSATE